MKWFVVVVTLLFGLAARADDAPFDTSSTVALLGKNIIVTLHNGDIRAGVLVEAGKDKIVLDNIKGEVTPVLAVDIESIRMGPELQTPRPAPAPAPVAPPASTGPPTEVTEALLNRFVEVRTSGALLRGQLVSDGPEEIVLKTAGGNRSVDRGSILAIVEDVDVTARPHRSDNDDDDRPRHRESADGRFAAAQAAQHADNAIAWYATAATMLALSAGMCSLGFFVCAPAYGIYIIVGGCALGVAGGAVLIYGLVESASASAAETKARAMAY